MLNKSHTLIIILNKLIFISIIALVSGPFSLSSQNLGTQRKTNQFTEYIDRHNENDIYDINDPRTYNGTPFANPSFLIGNVYMDNELISRGIALRYNVFADEIEVKESLQKDNNTIKGLTRSLDIYVTILNDTFVYLVRNESLVKDGYFQVLYKGTHLILYKKLEKKLYPPKKAATSLTKDVPATFSDRNSYFIATKENRYYELPSSKSKKIKVFEKNKETVKKIIKENNLDINKESDLIRLLKYIDGHNISDL